MREFIITIEDSELQSGKYGCKRKITYNTRISRHVIALELEHGFKKIKDTILAKEDLLDMLHKLNIMEE